MPKRIEISVEEAGVRHHPLHVEVTDRGTPPDVIRCGDGTLLVMVGKYLNDREDSYRYRIARIHEEPSLGLKS